MKLKKVKFRIETLAEAQKESLIRQKALKKAGTKESIYLANKLARCCCDYRCGSSACPVCFRENRKQLIKETRDLLKESGIKSLMGSYTLIFYSDQCGTDQLIEWDVDNLKNRLYKRLKKLGFNGVVIGGFEMDFHSESQLWLPHFHLLMTNDTVALDGLRDLMNKKSNLKARSGVKNRPMHYRLLKHPKRQISYLFKTIWSRIEVYESKDGKRRTKKYRLNHDQFIPSLLKLDSLPPAKLLFLYGLRRSKDGLSMTKKLK